MANTFINRWRNLPSQRLSFIAMATLTSVPIYTVDAFTNNIFKGNPAAVCPLDEDVSDDIKQKVAAELNLSETAFITKIKHEDSFENATHFKLRWFTPATEVPLCGHATLSTAAVIFNVYKNAATQLHFDTLSGLLTAKREDEFISLDFPLNEPEKLDQQEYEKFKNLINTVVGTLQYDELQYNSETKKLLIRLSDSVTRSNFEAINPSGPSMLNAEKTGQVKGVIVTLGGPNAKPYDFVSRYFPPWYGINEDPVTGAAHTVLAPYWAKELNKKQLRAFQCSKRGGELWLTVRDVEKRLDIKGHARIVIQGNLKLSV